MENIKLEDILKILEQFEKSSIDSLRYKTGEEEIELSRHQNGKHTRTNLQSTDLDQLRGLIDQAETQRKGSVDEGANSKGESNSQEEKGEEAGGVEINENLHTVISPIIGTFYNSPAPGKPAFVKAGDQVSQGDVLCIVEAMKVMNKIESDVSGQIEEVVAEDGQAVEYGTQLFKIRTG